MENKKYINSKVYYIDNFLPITFIDNLTEKVFSSSWNKHYSLGDGDNNEGDGFWALSLNEDFYNEELIFLKNQFPNNDVLRIYVNGQSGIQHGSFHQDDGEETFLIGLSKNLNVFSGGATEFYESENDCTYSIYPIYNRLIAFPSQIKHRALPNIDLNMFRMTLAIKTNKKQSNNKGLKFL